MAELQTGKLGKLGERLKQAASDTATSETLTCQWCSVTLPPGTTTCPTCGSTGVPDDSMVVPDVVEVPDDPLQESVDVAPKSEDELEEWWNEAGEESVYRNTAQESGDMMPVILALLGTAIVCVLLGVLVAPSLLASAFESRLGVTVEDSNDLRPLGGVLGLLTGAFIGAIGMWIAAPRK